jgi:hypothetical protein
MLYLVFDNGGPDPGVSEGFLPLTLAVFWGLRVATGATKCGTGRFVGAFG